MFHNNDGFGGRVRWDGVARQICRCLAGARPPPYRCVAGGRVRWAGVPGMFAVAWGYSDFLVKEVPTILGPELAAMTAPIWYRAVGG